MSWTFVVLALVLFLLVMTRFSHAHWPHKKPM